jgi:hypothetical protein
MDDVSDHLRQRGVYEPVSVAGVGIEEPMTPEERLISLAPEMVDVLARWVEAWDYPEKHLDYPIPEARDLLRRARGEE